MKKILFLLLLNVSVYAQISTGQETKFPYGIKNTGSQFVATPDTLVTKGTDGTYGHTSSYRLPISNDTFDALELKSDKSSTAIKTGCVISAGSGAGLFSVSAGTFMIADNSTGSPILTPVTFAGATDVAAIYPRTILYITSTGTLVQFNGATGDLSPTQRRQNLFLGGFAFDGVNVLAIQNTPNIDYDISQRFNDLTQTLGVRNQEGNVLTANGANLMINKTSGRTFRHMSNYQIDKNVPDVTTDNAAIPIPSGINLLAYRNGVGGWTYESYSGSLTPTFWDNGTGVKATVANNKFTIPRVYFFNGTDTYIIYLGQKEYGSIDSAIGDADRSDRAIDPATSLSSYRGGIAVEKSVLDLQAGIIANTVRFIPPPGGVGAAGGGVVGTQNIQSVYNNSVNPEITTDTTRGAFTVRNGQVSDTSNVLEGQNIAGSTTFSVAGNGNVTGGTYNGYIPENVANKSDSYTVSSTTTYPNTKGLVDGLATKQNTLTNPVTGTGASGRISFWSGTNTQSASPSLLWDNTNSLMTITKSSTGLFENLLSITNTSDPLVGATRLTVSTPVSGFQMNAYGSAVAGALASAASIISTTGSGLLIGSHSGASTKIYSNNSFSSPQITLHSSGNLSIRNMVDSGYALDLTGTARISSTLTLSTTPTTSAGTYDILTRNTSTGEVEKIASGGGFVTLTGNQTVSGAKSFTNTGSTGVTNGLILTNNGTGTSKVLHVINTSSGYGLRVDNSGTYGINISNSSGFGLYCNNTGTSSGFIVDNQSSGTGMVVNGGVSSTGYTISSQNSGTTKFAVTKEGTVMMGVYTVATLPTPTTTAYATVTDATAPTYLGTLTGGGAVVCPVFYNGSAWVSH